MATGVEVKIGDDAASLDDLYGRYQVKDFTQDANQAIATIDLDEFPQKAGIGRCAGAGCWG